MLQPGRAPPVVVIVPLSSLSSLNDTVLVKKLVNDALEALALSLKLQLGLRLSNENYMNMYHWLGGNDGVLPSPHYLGVRAAMRMSG